MEAIICAVITGFFGIVVTVIEVRAQRERKSANQRAEWRAEESRLSMQMADATLQLSIVTANALTGGHNNGNVERAREAANEASRQYEEFVKKLAAEQVAKI